jgi:hypothetical protein
MVEASLEAEGVVSSLYIRNEWERGEILLRFLCKKCMKKSKRLLHSECFVHLRWEILVNWKGIIRVSYMLNHVKFWY